MKYFALISYDGVIGEATEDDEGKIQLLRTSVDTTGYEHYDSMEDLVAAFPGVEIRGDG